MEKEMTVEQLIADLSHLVENGVIDLSDQAFMSEWHESACSGCAPAGIAFLPIERVETHVPRIDQDFLLNDEVRSFKNDFEGRLFIASKIPEDSNQKWWKNWDQDHAEEFSDKAHSLSSVLEAELQPIEVSENA